MTEEPDPSPTPTGSRPTLGERLQATLDRAVAEIPWYRDRAEVYGRPVATPEDLAALPVIDRATVLADPAAFAAGDRLPDWIVYSSSTTGGIGQPRWRSVAEAEAAVALLADGEPDPDDDGGVTLVIHPFDQGPPVAPAGAARLVYAGLLVPWHFDLIAGMLTDGVATPAGRLPVTGIDGFSPGLRLLTEWFEQRGIDPAGFGVARLQGFGSLQPAVWRRRLERAWGARYTDVYGLSDVVNSVSTECPLCHAYHHPSPVVAEVLDLVTREPCTGAVGGLVLTELYPYAQLQQLVRYWTDDVVELARPCPLGGFGFRLLGRRPACVVLGAGGAGGDPLVVGPLAVADAAADVPDVATRALDWAPWAHDAGTPLVALRGASDGGATAAPEVEVAVELRWSPGLHPGRAAAVADDVAAGILARVPALAAAVDEGRARLRVTTARPGGLGPPAAV